MASVKVKFRNSKVNGREGCLYYQIIHNRISRQISTGYRLWRSEWNRRTESVVLPSDDGKRAEELLCIQKKISCERTALSRIVISLKCKRNNFSADDIVKAFLERPRELSLTDFMHDIISQLKRIGRERTAETYMSTLNSLLRFSTGKDILLTEIGSDLLQEYEAYLKASGVAMNTVSFYMRILRAVYNRAVDKSIMEQQHPFKNVYTGIGKTRKRAISLKAIKQIKELDLSRNTKLDFARDMFMFSFYTRGMSFVDMAYLKKKDLKDGVLTYRRRKTGQTLCIKWEKCMEEIVDKYGQEQTGPYILPIIRSTSKSSRSQYKNGLSYVNRSLKDIALRVGLTSSLSMYVARHSWASIARSRHVPLSIISEGMGHDSEATTQIYLSSLDTSTVDRANNMIIKLI